MRDKFEHCSFSILCLLLVFVVVLSAGCHHRSNQTETKQSYSVVDSTGYRTVFAKKPKRVLGYNLTYNTMILGIVPPDYLVAKSYLDKDEKISYIAEATKNIQTEYRLFKNLSIEGILKMAPEVIFLPDTIDKKIVETLRSMGIAVIICKGPNTIQDTRDSILLIARALGEEDSGKRVIREMDKQLAEVSDRIKIPENKKPVAMLVSRMRQYGGIGCMYDDLCKYAGVRNAISMMGIKYGETVTKEAVVASDPDLFFVSSGRDYEEKIDVEFRKEFMEDPAFENLKGLNRVINIPDRYIYSNSQNCVYAIKGIHNFVYGPVFDLRGEALIKGY